MSNGEEEKRIPFNRNKDVEERVMITVPPETTWNGALPADDAKQKRGTNAKFSFGDGRVTLDWYEAYLLAGVRIDNNKKADLPDGLFMVPGTFSLIKDLWVKSDGATIYTGNGVSPLIFITKALETSRGVSESVSTNELFVLDRPEKLYPPATVTAVKDTNGGAAQRLLIEEQFLEIPLKNWGFFKALKYNMLPNLRLEIEVSFEDDAKVLFGAAVGRLIITSLELRVPKIEFKNQTEMMKKVLSDKRPFSFEEESILEKPMQKSLIGTTNLSKGILNPKHVFVWTKLSAEKAQADRGYEFVTFGNGMDFEKMVVEYGQGTYFPDQRGYESKDMVRMYKDAIGYAYKLNNPNGGGTCLDFNTWKQIYPFVHFDMRNMSPLGSDEAKQLVLEWKYSGGATADYTLFIGLIKKIETNFRNDGGKITIVRRG